MGSYYIVLGSEFSSKSGGRDIRRIKEKEFSRYDENGKELF